MGRAARLLCLRERDADVTSTIKLAVIASFLLVSAAHAQMGGDGAAQKAPERRCTPSGYAPPAYNMFGQNGGGGQAAFEIASPCTPQAVLDAAEAIGMGRSHPLSVKNVITVTFSVTGQMAAPKGMQTVNKADIQISYTIPAMRMAVDASGPDGKPVKEIRVFADDHAWNEAKEGMDAVPAMPSLADRSPLVKLTPFGALWSVIEAEGHATVTTVNGKQVLSGVSPYDGWEVTTTLDDKHRPESVTVKANGHVYGATFADYRDSWEPLYLVIFPSQINWTKDGKPLAKFTVTAFKSNPYVVFPTPPIFNSKLASK
jgi:hypothetical protein